MIFIVALIVIIYLAISKKPQTPSCGRKNYEKFIKTGDIRYLQRKDRDKY